MNKLFIFHKMVAISLLVLITSGAAVFTSDYGDTTGCSMAHKTTKVVYYCPKDPKPCPQDDTLTSTVSLAVSGSVVVVGAEGGVTFTYVIGGCDAAFLPADMRYEGLCDRESGVEFTDNELGSNKANIAIREIPCSGKFKVYSCIGKSGEKEFVLPDSVVDLLNDTVPGADPIKKGQKIYLPVVTCSPDEELQENACDGSDNTTKKVVDETCPNLPPADDVPL